MPTYQYACTGADCGNRFELVQSFTDPAATECPVCGNPVRKVFSSVGVVFKGSGFYRTDSRNDSGKSSGNSSGSGSKEAAASSTEASGGSKSADSSASTKAPAAASASSGSGGSSKAAASA